MIVAQRVVQRHARCGFKVKTASLLNSTYLAIGPPSSLENSSTFVHLDHLAGCGCNGGISVPKDKAAPYCLATE